MIQRKILSLLEKKERSLFLWSVVEIHIKGFLHHILRAQCATSASLALALAIKEQETRERLTQVVL